MSQVGKGKVIRGWDEGVATMKVGEVRTLRLGAWVVHAAAAERRGETDPNRCRVVHTTVCYVHPDVRLRLRCQWLPGLGHPAERFLDLRDRAAVCQVSAVKHACCPSLSAWGGGCVHEQCTWCVLSH